MSNYALWIALAATVIVGGCVGTPSPQTHGHDSGWSDQTRAIATETYSYAVLAAAAYPDNYFELGPVFRKVGGDGNGACGFAYQVFERLKEGDPVEVIIAFEGTEFTDINDWICGNILGRHNRWGMAVFSEWRLRSPNLPISVTGHSLGGGIATHISVNNQNVRSYAFNSSPRFWLLGQQEENRRISVVEHGEILKAARIFGQEADQLYMSIGCSRGGPVAQHNMIRLAACLTHIAAIGCQEAREMAERNPSLARDDVPWPRAAADETGSRCIRLPVLDPDAHPLELMEDQGAA